MSLLAVILIVITGIVSIGDIFFGLRDYGHDTLVFLMKMSQLVLWGSLLYLFVSSARRAKSENKK